MKTPIKALVTLLFIGLFCLPAMADNIPVSNTDFETWTNGASGPPDDWSIDTYITGTQEATTIHGGTYSCNLTWTSQTQASCDFISTDTIDVTAGTAYTYNVNVYDNDLRGYITIYFACTSTNGNSPNYWSGLYSGNSSDWQTMTYTFSFPDTVLSARLAIRAYDSSATWNGSATVYVDDLSLSTPTGNVAPSISAVYYYPYPTVYPTDDVNIRATITDAIGEIAADTLYLQTTTLTYNAVMHDSVVGDYYWYNVGTNAAGTLVEYYVTAVDDSAASTTSSTGSYTVSAEAIDTVAIAEIEFNDSDPGTSGCYPSPEIDNSFTITGIVTARLNNKTRYYLQDADTAWSAIYVYGSPDSCAIGDTLVMTGAIAEYYGVTEIASPTISYHGTGATVFDPVVVTSDDLSPACNALSESWESMLIKLEDVECVVGTSSGTAWVKSDGAADSCAIDDYLYSSMPTFVVGTRYNVTGIVSYYSSKFLVYPRGSDDIEEVVTAPTITDIAHYPSGTILPTDVVTVSAVITDDGTIAYDSLYYALNSGSYTPVDHDSIVGDTYWYTIGTNDNGAIIDYYVIAIDNDANRTESDVYSYFVGNATCTADNTIYDIQSSYTWIDTLDNCFPSTYINSGLVSVCGVVTAVDNQGSGKGVFLQDPDGTTFAGVLLYDLEDALGDSISFGSVAIGDYYQVSAEVQEYYGVTELAELDDFTLIGVGNDVPDPELASVLTLTQLTNECSFTGEAYEGVLTKLINVTCTSTPGYGKWWIMDSTTTDSMLLGPDVYDMTGATYPPAVGLEYEYIIGVVTYDSYDNVLKICPRMDSDLEANIVPPPSISAAYPIDLNTLCVFFDRALDQASAETPGNYSLNSGIAVTGATLQTDLKRVYLDLGSDMGNGIADTVNVSGVADTNDVAIVSASKLFWQGFTPISMIQDYVSASQDTSLMYGEVVTLKGFIVADTSSYRDQIPSYYAANNFYINDNSGETKNGVMAYGSLAYWDASMYRPTIGDTVVMTAQILEYYNETELYNIDDYLNVYLVSAGAVPEPAYKTTDAGEFDYNTISDVQESLEGVLVQLCDSLEIVRVDSDSDTTRILIMSLTDNADTIAWDYKYSYQGESYVAPEVGTRYDGLTGVVRWRWGYWRLQPRFEADLNTGYDCGGGPETYDYVPGDANMINGQWKPQVIGGDVTYLVNYFRGINSACKLDGFYCAADANGDCLVIGSDVTKLVNYFRGITALSHCANYEPTWLTVGDCPTEMPAGWPNCDTVITKIKSHSTGQTK